MISHSYVSLPEGKRERKGLEDTGNYGEDMVNKGNHPQMALRFRLVKYTIAIVIAHE